MEKVVNLRQLSPLVPMRHPWYSFLPEATQIAQPYYCRKDCKKKKKLNDPSGIEPVTFRLITQCRNQLRQSILQKCVKIFAILLFIVLQNEQNISRVHSCLYRETISDFGRDVRTSLVRKYKQHCR